MSITTLFKRSRNSFFSPFSFQFKKLAHSAEAAKGSDSNNISANNEVKTGLKNISYWPTPQTGQIKNSILSWNNCNSCPKFKNGFELYNDYQLLLLSAHKVVFKFYKGLFLLMCSSYNCELFLTLKFFELWIVFELENFLNRTKIPQLGQKKISLTLDYEKMNNQNLKLLISRLVYFRYAKID